MTTPHTLVTATARIAAPPERVYAIIANYRDGHPRILPKEFRGLTVEEGGIGAGTIIRFQMRVLGATTTYRAAITEPEPGRVLVETNFEGNAAVSTFTVNPQTRIGDISELTSRRRPIDASVRILRSIYPRELALLGCAPNRV
jgi:hypothetical protein